MLRPAVPDRPARQTDAVSELWLDDDPEVLRARGSLKWTATRGEIAAWVAESDLGTAPAVTAALHDAVDRGLTGYLPPALRTGTARSCAELYARRYGDPVDPGHVRLVPDVVSALRLTLDRLVRPGAAMVLPGKDSIMSLHIEGPVRKQ